MIVVERRSRRYRVGARLAPPGRQALRSCVPSRAADRQRVTALESGHLGETARRSITQRLALGRRDPDIRSRRHRPYRGILFFSQCFRHSDAHILVTDVILREVAGSSSDKACVNTSNLFRFARESCWSDRFCRNWLYPPSPRRRRAIDHCAGLEKCARWRADLIFVP